MNAITLDDLLARYPDLNRPGSGNDYEPERLAQAISDANAFVAAYVPEALRSNPLVTSSACVIARRYLYAIELPEGLGKRYDEAVATIKNWASLNIDDPSTPENDSQRVYASVESSLWGGLRRFSRAPGFDERG